MMAYLVRGMIRQQTGPRPVLGLLGLAALPWILGLVEFWLTSGSTLRDPSSAGLAGYAGAIVGQAQGTFLAWSLLGSAAFALTVATFIRRTRPVNFSDGIPVALAVIPAILFAIIFAGTKELGPFAASIIANPVSALLLLPFVGAATRRTPGEATVLPGIGAAFAFGLGFTAALSFAYSVGVERLIMALYSTAGVGAEAVRAGVSELGPVSTLPAWGIPFAFAPAAVVAFQLRRGGRKIQPAIAAATPVLLIAWGLQMLGASRTQATLTMLAGQGPAGGGIPESVPPIGDSVLPPPEAIPPPPDLDSTAGADFSGRGITGGIQGGVPGGVVPDAPDTPAELLTSVPAAYPDLARSARVAGPVEVEVEINSAGVVTRATARMGHPLLAPAAIAAVRQWRYRPAIRNGRPVASRRVEEVLVAP